MIYGFVYIWMDVKIKMFYIGSHMGTLDDGYIGSNIRLQRAYKKRPLDFKRKILYSCMEKSKLILQKEEERWLKMIKVEELGVKYYNLKRVATGGNVLESYNEEQKIKYREKLIKAANKGEFHHRARKVVCFNKLYNSVGEARKDIGFNPQKRLISRKYIDFYYFDEGPLTEEEILNNKKRKQEIREKCIKIRSAAISAIPKQKQKEKAIKSAKTRAITCPDIGNKISEGLKNRPGRKVSIDGVIYEKGRVAAEKLGMVYGTLKCRLKSKSFPSWFYLDDTTKNF